jgi:hypothetical protein
MIFAAKNQEARADRRDDAERTNRAYVEPSPCMVIPAVDLSALIPARFSAPRTIYEYLT